MHKYITDRLYIMDVKSLSCNIVVIGAGIAGIEAIKELSKYDDNFIIIEEGPLGSTLQRYGDIPSNILMGSALKLKSLVDIEKYGIKLNGLYSFDTSNVMNSLRAIRAKATNEVLAYLYHIDENKRIIGKAKFIDNNKVMVNDNIEIEFKSAIIATGAKSYIPYELSSLGDILTIKDIYNLDDIPKSLAVFGTSLQGLVIGQALSYLGTKVVVFADDNIWNITDNIVSNTARDILQKNIHFEVNSTITQIQKEENGYGIYYLDNNKYENYIFTADILSSAVPVANIEGLNIKNISLALDEYGFIEVNQETMQTNLPHIFAIGDVVNRFYSNTKSINDARIAAFNAAHYPYIKKKEQSYVRLDILNSDPPMAVVGLSFEQMKQRSRNGHSFTVSDGRMADGIYRARHEDGGVLRLYTDDKDALILGAEICGYGADQIAKFLAQIIANKKTIFDLEQYDFYIPSYEEVIAKAVGLGIKTVKRKGKY